jgi:hypothetical protein
MRLLAITCLAAVGETAAPVCANVDSRRCYVPAWKPTYSMWRSTILMPCNNSGVSEEGAEPGEKQIGGSGGSLEPPGPLS